MARVCLSAKLEISVALLHIYEIRVDSIVCLTCQSSFSFHLLSFCVFVAFFPSHFFLQSLQIFPFLPYFDIFLELPLYVYLVSSCLLCFVLSLYMFPLSIFPYFHIFFSLFYFTLFISFVLFLLKLSFSPWSYLALHMPLFPCFSFHFLSLYIFVSSLCPWGAGIAQSV